MPSTPAARLSRAIVGYLALMIAIITLAPFRFAGAPVHDFSLWWNARDALLNVALFVPIGFVHQLGRPRGAAPAWVPALLLGAMISALIETAQLFAPARFPSLVDIATNAIGAALGAIAAARATRRTEGAATVRAFKLDLPLVGLTYLLVPILWLGGLSSDPGEALLLVLPAGAAAWIVASVHVSYGREDGPPAGGDLLQPALAGALFVAIGFLPSAAFAPAVIPVAAAVVALVAFARLHAPAALTHERLPDGRPSRRFEAPTLRVALVPLVAFIVLHALWPLDAVRTAWRGTFALLPLGVEPDERAVFRIMAHASAFTALGYAIAERAGRASDSLPRVLPQVLGWSLALAVPLEVARGWRAGSVASGLVLAISVGAAIQGAWLFVLQLRNVRALLGR